MQSQTIAYVNRERLLAFNPSKNPRSGTYRGINWTIVANWEHADKTTKINIETIERENHYVIAHALQNNSNFKKELEVALDWYVDVLEQMGSVYLNGLYR